MRLLLFDWTQGGHHALYLQRCSQALTDAADVVVAAPGPGPEGLAGEFVDLGEARPGLDFDRPLPRQHAQLAERELDLLETAIDRTRPDRVVHLYADPVIRRLVDRRPLRVPTTLCVFFPRAHYPSAFGSRLPARERARALFLEYLVARWRRRPDAAGVWTLDEEAARRWSHRRGAPASWLPEPPIGDVLPAASPPRARSGCVVYGSLAPRKGIALLARALALEPSATEIVLAGAIEPGYAKQLRAEVELMESAGARVDLRGWPHAPDAGLRTLGQARCAALPYPRHHGMSRVLVEAAAVGTPMVAHRDGLVGHLVREHGLGVTVDCLDPHALRHALMSMTEADAVEPYRPALARFAAHFSAADFERRIRAAVGLPADRTSAPRTIGAGARR